MIAVLSLPWHWLTAAIIVGGIAYVGGHENGYHAGVKAERRRINEYRRKQERTR